MNSAVGSQKIDLEGLRRELAPVFSSYASAQESSDCSLAARCKKDVQAAIRGLLRTEGSTAPGIYVFVARTSADAVEPIYIGKADRLSERLNSWFKDELALDASLHGFDREEIWDTALRRIQLSMHNRDRRKHPQYAIQHVRTLWLVQQSDELWLISLRDSDLLRSAESLLIYTATSLGMRLFNAADSNKLAVGPSLGAASPLAISIVQEMQSLGLQAELVERWIKRLRTVGVWFAQLI